MTFGEVVNYEGKELVYLGQTLETIYFAIIPNQQISAMLKKTMSRVYGSTVTSTRDNNSSYLCFIELKTETFKERLALYGNRVHDKHNYKPEDLAKFMDVIQYLDLTDRQLLKKEILRDDCVPGDLKDVVNAVKLEG